MKKKCHKIKIPFVFFLFSVLVLNTGCHDILEDNIEGKNVSLTSPRDAYHTDNPKVTLTWEYLDGATAYNLKVVTPSFDPDSIGEILLDTNITVNSFTTILDKGKYQWGVKAFNGVSNTDLAYRDLYIDSIAVPDVTLSKPWDKKAFDSTSLSFSWSSKEENLQFIFSIDYEAQPLYITRTSNKGITLPADASNSFTLEEGNYSWQVKAKNTNGVESETEIRTFIIDRTAPGNPTLLSPKNDSLFSEIPITLSWKQKLPDPGSPIYDSIFIATDSLFTQIEIADKIVADTYYEYSPISNGTFYWMVKTYDQASNVNPISNWLKFRYNAK